MTGADRLLGHALRRAEIEHAPDPRVTVFDLSAERRTDAVVLSGTVLTGALRDRAVESVAAAVDAPVAATGVDVLESDARARTVSTSVAPVRADPDPDAEQVTQALYGAALVGYDRRGPWRRVRTPDGYVGWLRRAYLQAPTDIDPGARVHAETVTVDGDPGTLYGGTECELLDGEEEVRARFRTGAEFAFLGDAVGPVPESPTGEDVAATARRYLGTEYVWGGMTVEGLDCSGLSWMAYHRNGIGLPRDADLQRRMGRAVAREDLEAGDLLFFPGHVAISLGGSTVVHADGDAGEVIVQALDPDDVRYNPRLDEGFEVAKRLL